MEKRETKRSIETRRDRTIQLLSIASRRSTGSISRSKLGISSDQSEESTRRLLVTQVQCHQRARKRWAYNGHHKGIFKFSSNQLIFC